MKRSHLLIDQIVAAGQRWCRDNPMCKKSVQSLKDFLSRKVFVIDGIREALYPFGKGSTVEIPKRPPFDSTWWEWDVDYGGTFARMGVTVDRVDMEQRFSNLFNPLIEIEPGSPPKLFYLTNTFHLLQGSIHQCLDLGVFVEFENYRMVGGSIGPRTEEEIVNHGHVIATFGFPLLPVPIEHASDGAEQHVGWPAFMASMMLHCKNVSTRTTNPTPKENREAHRAGVAARRSYRMIEIKLPALKNGGTAACDPSHHNRFHLCRGHHKFLKHDRFKEKGWYWWPAHWRGSKALGIVDKDYAIKFR